MSLRLVPNSVTLDMEFYIIACYYIGLHALDDFERSNSPNSRVISPNSVAFGADYVKVVEDTPILSAAVM